MICWPIYRNWGHQYHETCPDAYFDTHSWATVPWLL